MTETPHKKNGNSYTIKLQEKIVFLTYKGIFTMLDQLKEIDFQNLNYAAKKQIIKGLKEQGDKKACYSIAEFLYDENKSIRELAMDYLIRIGGREVVESLLPFLQDKEAGIRNMAIEIIKEVSYENISLLTPLLKDPRECIRIYIIDLLGLIGNPSALDSLIIALQDISPNVRSSALASLGKLGDDRAISEIEKLLQTDKELWVIFSAIKSLENIKGRKAIQILLNLLTSSDEFILAAAIESLGEIGRINTIGEILLKIPNPNENMMERISACIITILQRETSTNVIEETRVILISFLRSCAGSKVNNWTRFRAIELLGKLEAQESLSTLNEIIQNDPPMLKIAAVAAMGNIGGEEARKILTGLLSSEDQNVQTVAQEALKRLNQ